MLDGYWPGEFGVTGAGSSQGRYPVRARAGRHGMNHVNILTNTAIESFELLKRMCVDEDAKGFFDQQWAIDITDLGLARQSVSGA